MLILELRPALSSSTDHSHLIEENLFNDTRLIDQLHTLCELKRSVQARLMIVLTVIWAAVIPIRSREIINLIELIMLLI